MNQQPHGEEYKMEDFKAASIYKFLLEGVPAISDSLRVTSCDIMCTTNTARLYELPPIKGAKKKAHLPYRQPDILPAFSSGATDMQLLVNSEAKAKRCLELKRERNEFISTLHHGRNDAKRREIYAATKIQAIFRGYRRRRGHIDLIKLEKERRSNPKLISSKEMREELTRWATAIGLKPVYGLSLESTIKKSLHQKKLEAHAANSLKNFLRVVVACSKVNKRRVQLFELKRNLAAITVQKFFKYIVFQTKLEGVVAMLKRKGAVQIQTYCRGFLARFRVQRIRKERRDQSKRIDAKIKLQRMFRKKYSSNSLVLVETALPGGVMPADAPAEDSKEEELARKKAMRAVEDARRMEVHSAEAP